MHALNHCYQLQVGQYLKHYAKKRPKILRLCLRVSYNSGIILSKMFTYYSQNYAGIIGAGLISSFLYILLSSFTYITPFYFNESEAIYSKTRSHLH